MKFCHGPRLIGEILLHKPTEGPLEVYVPMFSQRTVSVIRSVRNSEMAMSK